jgi:primary-amine oxidase
MDRRARVLLLDRATGQGSDLVVSVTEGRVVSEVTIDSTRDGHVPILDQEFEDIESFLLDCPEWIEAMAKRDLNPTDVRAVPLSAGVFGHEDEVGRRIVRVLAFYQYDAADLPWAHPIDGVVAYVDLTGREVVKVIDEMPSRPAPTSSPSRSPSPKARASPSTAIRSPGPTGLSGSDSMCVRA